MKSFTAAELRDLRASRAGPCISILLPTHRRHPEALQDPVRYSNLLRAAENLLSDKHSAKRRRRILDPLKTLTRQDYWNAQLDGLAVFSSAEFAAVYQIPVPLPERAVVADSFHIKPLLRYVQSDERFFALAVSQKQIALYEGAAAGVRAIEVPGLPQSAQAALGLEDDETYVNYHSSVTGRRAPLYPGQGLTNEPNQKDELAQFFRVVDGMLWDKILRHERTPLILLGVDYLLPIYRAISRYGHLLEECIKGNFAGASTAELHEQIWPVMADLSRRSSAALLADYALLATRGLAVDQLAAIAKAASEARIARLVIDEAAQQWGLYDRASGALRLHSSQTNEHDDDVFDDLAETVLDQGGEVTFVGSELMPSGTAAAALLRW